jgi:hypothetical protein
MNVYICGTWREIQKEMHHFIKTKVVKRGGVEE